MTDNRVCVAASSPMGLPRGERLKVCDQSVRGGCYTPGGVRELLNECWQLAGLVEDPKRGYLADLIGEGETVLIKPNLVKEWHPRDPNGWSYVLTNGEVISALCDDVARAVGRNGRIIIADAPQTDSKFEAVRKLLGLDEIVSQVRRAGPICEVVDLRKEEWEASDGVIVNRRVLGGDPEGYSACDLGKHSHFWQHSGGGRYYGADYDQNVVNLHHSEGRHEYLISRTALTADVVFNVPKLKTHKKAGLTASLKNLVGINGDKNWLPHHTEGTPREGGDERPNGRSTVERRAVNFVRDLMTRHLGGLQGIHRFARSMGLAVFGSTDKTIRSGNWYGNDTTWRMCLDLNRVLLYCSSDGHLRAGGQRDRKRYYCLVDAIVCGEGNGPMDPDPIFGGCLIFGTSPAAVDYVSAALMGFEGMKIPIIREAFQSGEYPVGTCKVEDVRVMSNDGRLCGSVAEWRIEETLQARPHFGWVGHIERGR